MNSAYQLSLNILRALGGDVDKTYPSVDAIWDEIYGIYDAAGGSFDIEQLKLDVTKNGKYDFFPTDEIDAFAPVQINVNVPQDYTKEDVDALVAEGYNDGYAQGNFDGIVSGKEIGYTDGYNVGVNDGAVMQKAKLTSLEITENGTYEREDGYSVVEVNVQGGSVELVEGSAEYRENGTYELVPSADGFSKVDIVVAVPQKTFETETLEVELTENGTYEYGSSVDGFSEVVVNVNVPSSGGSGGNGFDYSVIGYSSSFGGFINSMTQTELDKSVELYQKFLAADGSTRLNITSEFRDNLVYYPAIDMDLMSYNSINVNASTSKTEYFPYIKIKGTKYENRVVLFTFDGCRKLRYVEEQDWDNVSGSYFFRDCQALKAIPSNYRLGPEHNGNPRTSMGNLFYNCFSIESVPYFNTSNVTNMDSTFYYCRNLTSIPLYDTSNVTSMNSICHTCELLEEFPAFDTSKVTNMNGFVMACTNLKKIPALQCGNVSYFNTIFGYNNLKNLTDIGGFIDLGKQSNLQGTTNTYFLAMAPNLTRESVLNIINGLYDRASAGLSQLTFKVHANHLALLTDEEKAIVTNKGWILA